MDRQHWEAVHGPRPSQPPALSQGGGEPEDALAKADRYANHWPDRDEGYFASRLMQEVGELASSLVGDHEDPPAHEWRQIASIALNALRRFHGEDSIATLRRDLAAAREEVAAGNATFFDMATRAIRAEATVERLRGELEEERKETEAWKDACDREQERRLAAEARLREVTELHAADDWHEDDGSVLWWYLAPDGRPCEPPHAGTPLDSDWPGDLYTHWSKLEAIAKALLTPPPEIPADEHPR